MRTTTVTNDMILDFFAGSGSIMNHNAFAVERLIISTIEELLARGSDVYDLSDGGLISAFLKKNYGIQMPAEYSREFFEQYVKAIRSRIKR